MPFAWVAISQAARNQVRRPWWLPCSTVPAVTETWRSQAAHCTVSRSRPSSQPLSCPQAGQRGTPRASASRAASGRRPRHRGTGPRTRAAIAAARPSPPPPTCSGTTCSTAGTRGMSHTAVYEASPVGSGRTRNAVLPGVPQPSLETVLSRMAHRDGFRGSAMLVGYARVSTREQNHALQLDALRAAGCERFYTEKASGAQRDRPELRAALDYARGGDTL